MESRFWSMLAKEKCEKENSDYIWEWFAIAHCTRPNFRSTSYIDIKFDFFAVGLF